MMCLQIIIILPPGKVRSIQGYTLDALVKISIKELIEEMKEMGAYKITCR